MRPLRYILIMLAALMLLAPAALATGPSAGDQQYTDPLGGSNGTSNHTSSSGSGSSGSSSSTPASSAGSTSSATASASPSSIAPAPSTSTPTATTAQAAGSSLPRTGFNAWAGAAFGFVLLGAGFAVRRQVHRSIQ